MLLLLRSDTPLARRRSFTPSCTASRNTFSTASMLALQLSASVYVTIQGKENALIIPVDALHQTSSTSYVYTSYDYENHEYGGRKEVTTGLSNSSYVEISSGLSEGDTVYYVEKEDNAFPDFGGMGGGMPGGDMGGFGGGPGGSMGGFGGGMPGGNMGGGMPGRG